MFEQVMSQIERNLDIPYPARKEVLLEIEGHMAALYEELIQTGLSRKEAYRQTLNIMALDQAFVSGMAKVHRSTVAKALDGLPRYISLGIEFSVITAVSVLIVITAILQEAPLLQLLLDGGVWMIPISLAGAVILFFGIERVYSLYIKQDHSQGNLDKRLLSLKFLAVLVALTGIVGTLTGVHNAFMTDPAIIQETGEELFMITGMRYAITTSIWGFTLAIIAVVFRFIAQAKVTRIRSLSPNAR